MERYTAVVVLDEVGLAEDSPRMPLKALHPLLEDGCIEDEPETHKKVSFIGISNWALDPAKMNRGILLSRGTPTEEDLIKIGRGIGDKNAAELIHPIIPELAKGYLAVYRKQKREYFGLRDYYSLIKMISATALLKKRSLTFSDVEKCVRRNFGGYFGDFHPGDLFLQQLSTLSRSSSDHEVTQKMILEKCLLGIGDKSAEETRYLLLLTKNKAALQIIQMKEMTDLLKVEPVILFGSSFPGDQEYRQICTNINRIKMCMEAGKLVVLCYLDNLHESLYDALNQNYVRMGGNRYVDLGLGTHRVKCRVHPEFRLIMVAEDKDVYENFPIPLINRLEKHYLGMDTILENKYRDLVEELELWMQEFSTIQLAKFKQKKFKPYELADVFMGYHGDVIPGLIMKLQGEEYATDLLDVCKRSLLENATPDSIVRLSQTELKDEADTLFTIYFVEQYHDCLASFINSLHTPKNFVQATTRSKLFTNDSIQTLAKDTGTSVECIKLVSLHQFKTENEFRNMISSFQDNFNSSQRHILIIQLEAERNSANLTECAKFAIMEEMKGKPEARFDIVLIIQLSGISGAGSYTGFPSHPWRSVHIDELHTSGERYHLKIKQMQERKISQIFETELYEETGLLDLDVLMDNVLSQAAARVVDEESQDRMMIRMDLFREAYQLEPFKQITWRKIVQLLKKREEDILEPEKWLVVMATYNKHLREGATFQTAVWKHLLEVLSPCVSVILSVIDPHSNLELINGSSWQRAMFLDMYRLVDISQHYQKIQPERFPVLKLTEERFACSIPFVWNVIQDAEQCFKILDSDHLPQTDIQQVLAKYESEDNDFLDCYLNDFILLKMPISGAAMATLLKIFKTKIKGVKCDIALVTRIHSCYSQHYQELMSFRALVGMDPDILEGLDKIPDRVDIMVLKKFLNKHFVPNFASSNKNTLEVWSLSFFRVSPIIEEILVNTDPEDDEGKILRQKWDQVHMFHVFLRHIFSIDLGEQLFQSVAKNLTLLWKFIDLPDFESDQTFRKLVGILNKINRDGAKGLKLGGHKCVRCEESPKHPVILQCEHVGCEACLLEYMQTCEAQGKEKRCPAAGCKKPEISEDFQVKSTQALKTLISIFLLVIYKKIFILFLI